MAAILKERTVAVLRVAGRVLAQSIELGVQHRVGALHPGLGEGRVAPADEGAQADELVIVLAQQVAHRRRQRRHAVRADLGVAQHVVLSRRGAHPGKETAPRRCGVFDVGIPAAVVVHQVDAQ